MKPPNYFKITLSLINLATLLFAMSATASAASTYTITDLGDIYVRDINNFGQVVGSKFEGGLFRALFWENGMTTDLGSGGASGINDSGQIVGGTAGHAFLWEDGTITYLETPGYRFGSANKINNLGQVVGSSHNSFEERHLILWENGTMTDLGLIGEGLKLVYGINDFGQIIGSMEVGTEYQAHAFLWEDGTVTDLGTLGGRNSRAHDINNAGWIVGFAELAGGFTHACLWENGTITNLDPYQNSLISANGINNSGQIVGLGRFTHSEDWYAFLWDNGEIYNLNSHVLYESILSNWELKSAVAINDFGQIVGYGIAPDGEHHAFLLTPILVKVDIDIDPDTLNLSSNGRWITCYIQLPEGYDVTEADSPEVFLEDTIPGEVIAVDEEEQLITAKFIRSNLQTILDPGEAELTVRVELLDGTMFEGTDTITVIDRGK